MINIPYPVTLTGVKFLIGTQGSSVTAGNIGLYNSTTRLAQVGTTAGLTAFQSAAGSITAAFTSTYSVTTPGVYWIGFYVTATTTPALLRHAGTSAFSTNANIGGVANTLTYRSSTLGTGSLPTTISGTPTSDALMFYMSVY
jgi:hypothetical protein